MRSLFLWAGWLACLGMIAQDDMIAYVPRKHLARVADSGSIVLTGTNESGIYLLDVPAGTWYVDLLGAGGDKLEPQPVVANGKIDIRQLKPSTYTIRAHRASGITIRRFALLGRGANLWAIDAEPAR